LRRPAESVSNNGKDLHETLIKNHTSTGTHKSGSKRSQKYKVVTRQDNIYIVQQSVGWC